MNSNLKLIVGIQNKLLYMPQTLQSLTQMVTNSPNPTNAIGKVLAVVFQQALAKAQQAGAQPNNQIVMQAIMLLTKEAVDIVDKNTKLPDQAISALAKTILASTLAFLKQLTTLPKPGMAPGGPQGAPQSAPVSNAQPQTQPQGQPMQAPPQPGGLLNQAMGVQ